MGTLVYGTVLLAGFCLGPLSQDVPYGIGTWDADKLGNHRAVLQVLQPSDAVWAHVPWRRRDEQPETKNILLIEAGTGVRVSNLLRANINRSFGDIIFQARRPGTYYAYFMPYVPEGRNYPKVTYQKPEESADPEWLERHGFKPGSTAPNKDDYPQATLAGIEAVDDFSSFYPMEVIATRKETTELLSRYPDRPYLLFAEDRAFPIRMVDDLPYRWIKSGPAPELAGHAKRGEFYVFQIGVFAAGDDIRDIRVHFSGLKDAAGKLLLPPSALHSFNTGGVNWDGKAFNKPVKVNRRKVQPLWFGLQIPAQAPQGQVAGQVVMTPDDKASQTVRLALTVDGDAISDSGDDEPWRHSRLRWLDSRLAVDDETVRPFTPMTVNGDVIGILGRTLTVESSGLPRQIESYFSPEVTHIEKSAKPSIWKVWDEFRIQKSEMFGYWSPRCPVRTDNERVLATAYVGAGKTLIAIASWAEADASVRLSVDWRALGLNAGKAILTAPPVKDFQPAAQFRPADSIPVPKGKGWLVILGPD
jgi:hypothetical protein